MTRMELNGILRDRLLVCDGAMGTQLMKLGLTGADCGEGWNIERAADVTAIHKAYLEAGCDLVTTNTFGGTSCALERHGLKTQVHELNQAGAKLGSHGRDGKWKNSMGAGRCRAVRRIHRTGGRHASRSVAGNIHRTMCGIARWRSGCDFSGNHGGPCGSGAGGESCLEHRRLAGAGNLCLWQGGGCRVRRISHHHGDRCEAGDGCGHRCGGDGGGCQLWHGLVAGRLSATGGGNGQGGRRCAGDDPAQRRGTDPGRWQGHSPGHFP
ncbi:MAG: hypothetical protein HC898_00590 [Phycisphaerales bacterium]|nr:hypothetical protein [Phycisphaerales bacterium]